MAVAPKPSAGEAIGKLHVSHAYYLLLKGCRYKLVQTESVWVDTHNTRRWSAAEKVSSLSLAHTQSLACGK